MSLYSGPQNQATLPTELPVAVDRIQLYAYPLSLDLIYIKDALDWVDIIRWLFHLLQESRDEFVFVPTFRHAA